MQKKRIERHRRCARTPDTREWMVRSARRHRQRFKDHRREQLETDCIPGVTVYSGGGGCWSIPYDIVACESGGSWSAYNPSGARGPYQLLGWPVPWPVGSVEDKRAHHRMASQLWAGGSGRGHWVC